MADGVPQRRELIFDVDGPDQELRVQSGVRYRIQVKGLGHKVGFRVLLDPEDPDRTDDTATLECDDRSYSKVVRFDDCADIEGGKLLVFTGVKPDRTYSLVIDPGAGAQPYYLFKGQPFRPELMEKVKYQNSEAPTGPAG